MLLEGPGEVSIFVRSSLGTHIHVLSQKSMTSSVGFHVYLINVRVEKGAD